MSDDKNDKKTGDSDTGSGGGGGVVKVRQVITRPMSWQERAERRGEGPDVAELHPNAPKPKPRNDYRPVLKQLKRRHKSDQREQPAFMSDVKI